MLDFILVNHTIILAALLAISEILALIPAIKANGIFDGIVKLIVWAKNNWKSTPAA